MSLGYCGKMELFIEDEAAAIYRYAGEDLNDTTEVRGDIKVLTGEILIHKRCLVEPSIHSRVKRTALHRKTLITKRVIQPFDIEKALKNGDIEILKPCAGEKLQELGTPLPYFAIRLLHKLFTEYQENGALPEKCGFFI